MRSFDSISMLLVRDVLKPRRGEKDMGIKLPLHADTNAAQSSIQA